MYLPTGIERTARSGQHTATLYWDKFIPPPAARPQKIRLRSRRSPSVFALAILYSDLVSIFCFAFLIILKFVLHSVPQRLVLYTFIRMHIKLLYKLYTYTSCRYAYMQVYVPIEYF